MFLPYISIRTSKTKMLNIHLLEVKSNVIFLEMCKNKFF